MTAPAPRATRNLDCRDPAEIEAFERAFYAGFEAVTHNRLVQWLWDWDHARRRLRTRIPYADQRIWVLDHPRREVRAAIAVNVRLHQLQGAAFGFAVPGELREAAAAGQVCEFLAFFADGEPSLARKLPLWREMFRDLSAAGFTHALATTAPRLLPLYRWIDARVIQEAQLEGETRYFLLFDLSRTRRGSRARTGAGPSDAAPSTSPSRLSSGSLTHPFPPLCSPLAGSPAAFPDGNDGPRILT